MDRPPCVFCGTKESNAQHFGMYGAPLFSQLPLIETEHAKVHVDVLPVGSDGLHFLVIPNTHVLNSSLASPESIFDMGKDLYLMENIYKTTFFMAEHGGSPLVVGTGSIQSVYHSHIHAIGTQGLDCLSYMRDVLKTMHIDSIDVKASDPNPSETLRGLYTGHPYLYFQQGMAGLFAVDIDHNFPSQITQRSMSRLFNKEVLNWKNIPREPELARLSVQRTVHAHDNFRAQ